MSDAKKGAYPKRAYYIHSPDDINTVRNAAFAEMTEEDDLPATFILHSSSRDSRSDERDGDDAQAELLDTIKQAHGFAARERKEAADKVGVDLKTHQRLSINEPSTTKELDDAWKSMRQAKEDFAGRATGFSWIKHKLGFTKEHEWDEETARKIERHKKAANHHYEALQALRYSTREEKQYRRFMDGSRGEDAARIFGEGMTAPNEVRITGHGGIGASHFEQNRQDIELSDVADELNRRGLNTKDQTIDLRTCHAATVEGGKKSMLQNLKDRLRAKQGLNQGADLVGSKYKLMNRPTSETLTSPYQPVVDAKGAEEYTHLLGEEPVEELRSQHMTKIR